MPEWRPLPPTALHRWLHEHRRPLHVVLAAASAALAGLVAWLVLAHRVGWAVTPVVAYGLAQIAVLHVWLDRARLRVEAADRPGGPGSR